nr:four-carbon acid sugar kinase family protein [Microcella alkalica]
MPAPLPLSAATVQAAAATGATVIVLDDDPTGTQSVSDLPVLTRWEVADLRWALDQGAAAVYVLTNTRSLDPEEAAARNREVVLAALAAAEGRPLAFASRSDSTLRGHYPLETDVIARTLGEQGQPPIDGVVIVPAFPDAGRVTLQGVHYLRKGDELVPAADTEFAADATFGYRSSALPEWVEEKSGGRIPRDSVAVIDLATLRGDADAVLALLDAARDAQPIVVDCLEESDLRALALALIESERGGRRFLYRVGPPFVRARIGLEPHAPLDAGSIPHAEGSTRGGLIVVGSHVSLTTRQLEALQRDRPELAVVEMDVDAVLDPARRAEHVAERTAAAVAALADDSVIVHTTRLLRRTDDADESLRISRAVSGAVVELVRAVLAAAPPRFVIAKGGITSSDVAAHGLEIRHAIVRGPMLPGIVSLWEPVDGPAQGIPYIVFAGNVGDDLSLAAVVRTLSPVTEGALA